MARRKWYEELYADFGYNYENEPYVKGTEKEVDFIEKEIEFNKDLNILDVGCGTGRHLLELARRGYKNLVGVDLSASMLKRARQKASAEKLKIELIQNDAQNLNFCYEFDLIISICEGAFSLMEDDQKDFEILKGIFYALVSDGKFILTTPNALYPLSNPEKVESFDPVNMREDFELEFEDDSGRKNKLKGQQRFYLPSEISWRLKSLGFSRVEFLGSYQGKDARKHPLTEDHFEMTVIATK